jgi:hypothetical protein
VEKLYHFTPIVNLESILKHGLASQRLLEAHGVNFFAPDRYRFDDRPEALSMSVHSINQALLLAKIAEHGGEWAILEIEASVLWTHHCRFCWTNAASADVTNYTAFLGGPYGFEEMFRDRPLNAKDLRSQRETYNRRGNQPTDVQAEVQVFDPIDSDLIVDITVKSERVKRQVQSMMERIGEHRPVEICEQFFQ